MEIRDTGLGGNGPDGTKKRRRPEPQTGVGDGVDEAERPLGTAVDAEPADETSFTTLLGHEVVLSAHPLRPDILGCHEHDPETGRTLLVQLTNGKNEQGLDERWETGIFYPDGETPPTLWARAASPTGLSMVAKLVDGAPTVTITDVDGNPVDVSDVGWNRDAWRVGSAVLERRSSRLVRMGFPDVAADAVGVLGQAVAKESASGEFSIGLSESTATFWFGEDGPAQVRMGGFLYHDGDKKRERYNSLTAEGPVPEPTVDSVLANGGYIGIPGKHGPTTVLSETDSPAVGFWITPEVRVSASRRDGCQHVQVDGEDREQHFRSAGPAATTYKYIHPDHAGITDYSAEPLPDGTGCAVSLTVQYPGYPRSGFSVTASTTGADRKILFHSGGESLPLVAGDEQAVTAKDGATAHYSHSAGVDTIRVVPPADSGTGPQVIAIKDDVVTWQAINGAEPAIPLQFHHGPWRVPPGMELPAHVRKALQKLVPDAISAPGS